MLLPTITLLLVSPIHCEWVEIAQQYYQKPVKTAHNYPFFATTDKVGGEAERTTNKNRAYINNSLPDYKWNAGFVNNFGDSYDYDDVKFRISAAKFKERGNYEKIQDFSESGKNKGDGIVIRKVKPEKTFDEEWHEELKKRKHLYDNTDKHRSVNKEYISEKSQNDYENLEILNLSDIGDTTEVYISTHGKPKQNVNAAVIAKDNENHSKGEVKRKQAIDPRTITKQPLLKTTNMRRVEIIRSTSTVRTPTEQFEEDEYQLDKPLKPLNMQTPTNDKQQNKQSKQPPSTPYKFPNIGVVKRVNITSTARPKIRPEENIPRTTISGNDEEKFTEHIEKKFNTNRRIDSPYSQSTTERTRTTPYRVQDLQYDSMDEYKILSPDDIMVKEIIKEEPELDITVHKVASIAKVKRVQNPKESQQIRQNDNIQHKTNFITTQSSHTSLNVNKNDDNSKEEKYKVSNFPSSTEEMPPIHTNKQKPKKNIALERLVEATQIEGYQSNPYKPLRPSQESMPEFVTKDETFIKEKNPKDQYEQIPENMHETTPTEPTFIETPHKRVEANSKENNYQKKIADDNVKENNEVPVSSETKTNAIENLIKFLKTVTDIITKNSRKGVLGKMRYLQDLRDTILVNIEERLEAAFPDEDQPRRRARSSSEARGHVEFPSSESALMTISFLTFAVFLIKLVLQVIQAYKNKAMMVMPTVISAASRSFSERQTRN